MNGRIDWKLSMYNWMNRLKIVSDGKEGLQNREKWFDVMHVRLKTSDTWLYVRSGSGLVLEVTRSECRHSSESGNEKAVFRFLESSLSTGPVDSARRYGAFRTRGSLAPSPST
jgi:hypothetical protein